MANRISDLDTASLTGHVAQIHGYVAERLAAQALQSRGVEVLFPELSNQPGFDLLVNGSPFQVKCLESPAGVLEYLDRYPDIPVLVNEDLAEQVSGLDNVYPVSGLKHADVVHSTKDNIAAGKEMFDLEIPYITLAVAAGRNIYALVRGQTDVVCALQNIVTDVAGGRVGAWTCSKILSMAGVLIAPHAALIGGIIGSIGGYAGGRRVARWVRDELFCQAEHTRVENACVTICKQVLQPLEENMRILEEKTQQYERALKDRGRIKTHLWDDFSWRLAQEREYLKDKVSQLRAWIRDPHTHPARADEILHAAVNAALLPAQCGVHPHYVKDACSELCDAVNVLVTKRKKLSV